MPLTIREASSEDVPLILDFIQQLAEYEKLRHECVATEESLRETLFGARRYAEVVIGYEGETPAGFALFFHNYSTFLGKPGLYLEDLFVKPEMRGRGYGKELLRHLARIAMSRNCGRMEWWVLDWNEPSINFYKSLGATIMPEWELVRMTRREIESLAKR